MGESKTISRHFDRIASKYGDIRDTDPHVVDMVISHLPVRNRPLDLIDIGCGTGRYTDIMARRLIHILRVFCCDCSAAMLTECRKRMERGYPGRDIEYCRVSANDLPFVDDAFDVIVTFNAVHHFDLDRFLSEASRLLRPGGLLSIYTRTPEQNARTIWGQHFPGFTDRESRLYGYERLEKAIDSMPRLELGCIQDFSNKRNESVTSLLKRAYNFHYSTFTFYPRREFMRAARLFADRLSELSKDGLIEHIAENTLVLARRKSEGLRAD
jgi:ubiquinone/menaquinone biosynthesis C-methylase UbiE